MRSTSTSASRRSHVTSVATPAGDMPLPASAKREGPTSRASRERLEVGHALVQTPGSRVDLVGGARYLRIRTRVDVELGGIAPGVPSTVSVERNKDALGRRGRPARPRRHREWMVRAVLTSMPPRDRSRFTYQAFAGIGRHFAWGDAMVAIVISATSCRTTTPCRG
jgi:hypothetical protein